MDEWTFQRELHHLKQRVADMAAKHLPPSPRSEQILRPFTGEGSMTQVDDLKQHIARLEQAFGIASVGRSPNPGRSHGPEVAPPQPGSSPQPAKQLVQPSGTQVWQLLMEIVNDVQCINNRCLDVERTVSDLEDKMNHFDPDRFTPAGSDASTDEGVGLHPAHYDTCKRLDSAPENPHTASATAPSGLECSHNASPSAVPGESEASLATPTQVAEGLLRAKLGASQITLDILRTYNAKLSNARPIKKQEHDVVRAVIKLHCDLAVGHVWNAPGSPHPFQYDSEVPEPRETTGLRRTSVAASELDAPETIRPQTEELPVPSVRHVQAEGVAFRDHEISRLEELLSNAQEAARLSEQQACQDQQALEALQESFDVCGKENVWLHDLYLEREAELCKLKEDASQREVHLQQLNDYLHTRDEQRERYHENYRQVLERSREKSAIINSAECRVEELQRLLQDSQNAKDEEIDHMMQGREEEIRRLQSFCEQKDEIAHSQEQIIARGARLMEQKDEEIEVLARRVKALQNDNTSEKKQRQLVSRLLEERDGELVSLKARPTASPTSDTHNSSKSDLPREAAVRNEASPFALHRQTSWSPRPIPGDRRLLGEARRASAWEQGTDSPAQPEFGRPGPIDHKRHLDPPRRHRSSPHPRKIRYLIDGQLVDGDGEGRPLSPQPPSQRMELRTGLGSPAASERHPSNRRNTEARQSLPMDRTAWPPQPPLPAPTAANRMQSLADLRSAARSEQLQRVVKHQSMQELKRRDHQAYVETEAESGGEFGEEA